MCGTRPLYESKPAREEDGEEEGTQHRAKRHLQIGNRVGGKRFLRDYDSITVY